MQAVPTQQPQTDATNSLIKLCADYHFSAVRAGGSPLRARHAARQRGDEWKTAFLSDATCFPSRSTLTEQFRTNQMGTRSSLGWPLESFGTVSLALNSSILPSLSFKVCYGSFSSDGCRVCSSRGSPFCVHRGVGQYVTPQPIAE